MDDPQNPAIKQIERIGDATLYLGDCPKILPTLGPVDAVVTDPPYMFNDYSTGNKGFDEYEENIKQTKELSDGFDHDEIFCAVKQLMPKFSLYCFVSNNQLPGIAQWGLDNKYQTYILTWNKLSGRPFGKTYLHNTEFIVHIKEPGALFNVAYTSRILTYPSNRIHGHPTEKPLPLIERLVFFSSNIRHSILDPFMGSGTTGVACANLGRQFIGIEIEPKYFDIACKRIEQAYQQPRLFDDKELEKVEQLKLGGEL